MTLVNRRGAYMRFGHDRQSDWDWLREWGPSVVRIMLPGQFSDPASVSIEKVQRVHEIVPGALKLLRVWDADDHNRDRHREMAADPQGFAFKQMRWWSDVFDRIDGVPRNQLMAGLNNEVNVDQYGPELYAYTVIAMGEAQFKYDMRLGVGMFSVGTPGKPGETPYGMTYYSRWEPAILAGNHALVLHEYMQPEGMYAVWTDKKGVERHDFENLINRHIHWPMTVPTIIGEGGIDGLLWNRHPDPEHGHSGWQNFPALWTPTRNADEYVERCKVADPSVESICDFIVDPVDVKWNSFDPAPAFSELLVRKDACEIEVEGSGDGDHDVYLPIVIKPPKRPDNSPPLSTGIIDPSVALAIMDVEAGGDGFVDGRLKIRFEAHVLQRLLAGLPAELSAFDTYFKIADTRPWEKPQWMKDGTGDWAPIHTGNQRTEYRALELASHIDAVAAYESLGMGIGQTMGENHARLGYASAQAMFDDYSESLPAQIVGTINYILGDPHLVAAVRVWDWEEIARRYNGRGAVKTYAPLLEAAYAKRVANG